MDVTAMESFLGNVTDFFGASMNWLNNVMSVITASPALTVMILAMPIVGFVVGLFSRLLRA